MPLCPLPVALGCFGCFAVALGSQMTIAVPARVVRPALTKYTGRLTFLTVQTNILCCLYFLGVLVTGWGLPAPAVEAVLVRTFPLCFSLGFFVTPAYYGLNHFNEQSIQIRRKFSEKYPYVWLAAHLEHCFALPAVVAYARCLTPRVGPADTTVFVGGYAAAYLAFTLALKRATGEWVYPVFNDVYARRGVPGVLLLLAVLCSLFVLFGFVGTALQPRG